MPCNMVYLTMHTHCLLTKRTKISFQIELIFKSLEKERAAMKERAFHILRICVKFIRERMPVPSFCGNLCVKDEKSYHRNREKFLNFNTPEERSNLSLHLFSLFLMLKFNVQQVIFESPRLVHQRCRDDSHPSP